jgi:peptidoglycan/xylan/chitin deacetylase (PgdA/CDA1 family)
MCRNTTVDNSMNNSALVSLTFDDGLRCQFERAVPILDQHGFAATFFLVANTDRIHTDGIQHPAWSKTDWNARDIEFLKGMVQTGHEIGAHSVHHRQPFLDNNPKFEAEESKHWIESRLDIKVSSYCYPFCHVTAPIKNAVINAAYMQARGGANAAYYQMGSTVDWFNVDCREQDEDVGAWVRPDHWHVLMFHGIGTEADGWHPVSVDKFTAQMATLAQHRDSGAVEIVTFQEGANRLKGGTV